MAKEKIKVGIVGGTGYTGVELLRLLAQHPQADLVAITSRSDAGNAVSRMFPSLRGHISLNFCTPEEAQLEQCDVVFFATPNGTAMNGAPPLLAAGVRIIDLAADFRLRSAQEWQQWYGSPHACPHLLDEAVYGLPELNRERIRRARLIANPGCYPTAVQLGLLPLLEAGIVEPSHIIADCKSGVSGAGRKGSIDHLLCEASENFKAYGVMGHRHLPEIRQGLSAMTYQPVDLTFVPHLTPMIRGIHATIYTRLKVADSSAMQDLQSIFEARYASEPFVDVLPAGSFPETRTVRGANTCRIAVHRPQNGQTIVVLSVIDNLVKGAAGQAVQNMNIMFGFPETAGLEQVALIP